MATAPKLTRRQGQLLSFLFERVSLGEAVSTLDLALSGKFSGRFLLAHAKLDERSSLVFNLPTYCEHVFFGLAGADVRGVASVLANLEDYEREGGELKNGETIRLPDTDKRHRDLYAALLLRTATLPELTSVPDQATIDGIEAKFSLAIPLSLEEYDYRRARGHDALMDKFQNEGKDLLIL